MNTHATMPLAPSALTAASPSLDLAPDRFQGDQQSIRPRTNDGHRRSSRSEVPDIVRESVSISE
jgi:hypothetical protein